MDIFLCNNILLVAGGIFFFFLFLFVAAGRGGQAEDFLYLFLEVQDK